MSVLKMEMSVTEMIAAMAKGNPGALVACCSLIEVNHKVDPDSALEDLGSLFTADSLGIYGSRLYMLWSDVCHKDPVKTIAVLRAYQLGLLSSTTLNHAIDNRGEGLDLDFVVRQVQNELPAFARQS